MSTPIPAMTPEKLRALNSATQYPSIPTYHILGERGRLTEERSYSFTGLRRNDIEVTEKIDGTNARIIMPPGDMGAPLIGSRNELLYYLADVLANPAQGIVEAIRGVATAAADVGHEDDHLFTVLFGEVYGGKVGSGSKNYSTAGTIGFRLFDVALVDPDVLTWPVEKIAAWRDGGGQRFATTHERNSWAHQIKVDIVPGVLADPPPESVVDTSAWLAGLLTRSLAVLDDTGKGKPEGVVVRTLDRRQIAKIRFEDYERTLRAGGRH